MKAKGSAPDVATTALIEWLTFGNNERPPGFRMTQAVCDAIWRGELWALDTAALARHYAQHKADVDGLAVQAGRRPWVLDEFDRERERRGHRCDSNGVTAPEP